MTGEADADTQEGGLGCAIAAGQAHDLLRAQPRDAGDARGIVRPDRLRERREAERGAPDIVAIDEALGDEHVHHAQGERAIGARPRLQVEIRAAGGGRAVGIDADHEGAALARALDERHQVDVGVARIDAPQHDELRVHQLLGVVARHGAERGRPPGIGGGDADAAIELGGAEGVEEGMARPVLQEAERAAVGVGQDRLAAPLANDAPPSVGDLLEGGLPRDGLESSLALGPHAPERRAHASGRVEPLRVVVHLAADHALGEGMGRVARDVGHAAVLDGDGQGALRRAIVRTDGPARFTHGGSSVTHVV